MTALRKYLAEKNIRPVDFASESGLSAAMVSLYSSGDRRPGLEAALRIEKATRGAIPASYWLTLPRRKTKHAA